jgi:hypothetical protein
MTGFEFVESVTYKVPDVSEDLDSFNGKDFAENHGLLIEIAAIHEGLTQNYTFYTENELENSLVSWTTPYPKPIIINHDLHSDPLGRIMGARVAKEADGTPFVQLQAAITSVEAIQRIKDQRYLTGSVGGKAEEAICSICDVDWASESQKRCKHKRGKVYSGKLAALHMRGIQWKEYSFVNAPSDMRSGVRASSIGESEGQDWVRPIRFIVLDLDHQNVMQLNESESSTDILGSLKKKDVTPMYLGLKGSYLSVMAVEESLSENIDNSDTSDTTGNEVDIHSQEKPMPKAVSEEVSTDQDDDILAAVESLEDETTIPAEEAEVETEAVNASEEEENSELVAEDEQAEVSEEETVNEDVDSEVAEEEAKSEDSEEVTEEAVEDAAPAEEVVEETAEEVEVAEEEADEVDSQEQVDTSEQADDTELEEANDPIEPPVEELKSRVDVLEDENARLKKLVKRNLVEDVVDRKISVGIVAQESRQEAIEEHFERTASSLVDTLRDLEGMKSVEKDIESIPQIEETSYAINQDNTSFVDEADEAPVDPREEAENLFVDVFMGRRKL